MQVLFDSFTVLAVSAGAVFFLAGTVGLLRFPDSLSRLHALTKADNLGLGLVVLGLLPQADWTAGGAEADYGLAAGPIGRRDSHPTRCSRGAAREPGGMTAAMVLDVGLALLVVAVAVWIVAAGSAFAAVVGFVSFGLLLALAWVRLAAVDVALTEAAIGSGVTGALLMTAASRLRPTKSRSAGERPGAFLHVVAAVLAVLVSAGLAALVLIPASPAPSLAPAAAVHLPELDVLNPVTAVLMAYRAVDTLLEKIVLLLALIGVWSLAPDRFWGGAPGLWPRSRPDGALTLLARLLPPIGIVVGIYILWVGAIAPGGAFQGGAILAAMWLLIMIAGLRPVPEIGQTMVTARAGRRAGGLPDGGVRGICPAQRLSVVPGTVHETADHRHRGGVDLVDRRDPRSPGRRPTGTRAAAMNAATLYGLCSAALVGLGLFGAIVHPQPLRKILAFNLLGGGVFLQFGVIARRGAAAGMGGDPVPQAMVITGIVVAFSATALAVTLLLRLYQVSGSATLSIETQSSSESDGGGR